MRPPAAAAFTQCSTYCPTCKKKVGPIWSEGVLERGIKIPGILADLGYRLKSHMDKVHGRDEDHMMKVGSTQCVYWDGKNTVGESDAEAWLEWVRTLPPTEPEQRREKERREEERSTNLSPTSQERCDPSRTSQSRQPDAGIAVKIEKERSPSPTQRRDRPRRSRSRHPDTAIEDRPRSDKDLSDDWGKEWPRSPQQRSDRSRGGRSRHPDEANKVRPRSGEQLRDDRGEERSPSPQRSRDRSRHHHRRHRARNRALLDRPHSASTTEVQPEHQLIATTLANPYPAAGTPSVQAVQCRGAPAAFDINAAATYSMQQGKAATFTQITFGGAAEPSSPYEYAERIRKDLLQITDLNLMLSVLTTAKQQMSRIQQKSSGSGGGGGGGYALANAANSQSEVPGERA